MLFRSLFISKPPQSPPPQRDANTSSPDRMSELVEQFSRFAELFAEPIILVSNAGHLCAANSSAKEAVLHGSTLAPEQLISELVADPPEKVADYLRACSRTSQPLPGLLTFHSPFSEPAAFRCFGSSFKARDGAQRPLVVLRFVPKHSSTSRFIALNQQIEQLRNEIFRRVKAERRADEERELLQVTLASIGDAVVATDMEGRVTFMNPVAEAHMGVIEAGCLGRPLEEVFVIVNEDTRQPVENPVAKVMRTGTIVGLANHTVLIRPDGSELPIDDSAAPIRDASGVPRGVILVFHEISESRQLQRQLMKQADALREADRRKDEFLAVLAHELRNPLAPLRNGLQIARQKLTSGDGLTQTVEMMERQLVHLVRLVDDLMDVNRVSRGAIELRIAPVSIADVLARSIESVSADIEARHHAFDVDVPAEPIMVNGDRDRLEQIFSNLLTNSAKYSGEQGNIRLSAKRDGGYAVIEVCDEGIGIPTEQLDRVFEMFSQVRSHQGRSEGGLGIGLSLVRTLVDRHGGSVTAHSDGPGTGSTFRVRLPVLESSPIVPIAPTSPRHRPVHAMRIVVADDNSDSAESLRMLLEMSGHQVRTARTGHEALALLDAFGPQIIFMDLGMPELDGVEATRTLRARPEGRDVIVVALTGWGQPQHRERTRLAGFDRHLVKPIEPSEIDEIILLAQSARDRP